VDIEQSHPFPVKINWTTEQGTIWWNETCADVLEIFGLPGDRFIYKPYLDYMIFNFKTEKDAIMCKILLSERL